MRVIIGCEFSGAVRRAFRGLGHDAWSCDLLPAKDGSEHHIQGDVLRILDDGWDIGIFHPPCTYLTNSAAWAFKPPDFERYPGVGYHQKVKPGTLVSRERCQAREEALEFVEKLMKANIPRIAIENPIGVISTRIRKYDQCIQPHQFGEDASKSTCLWLKNLPLLVGTGDVAPRIANGKPRWANQTDNGQNKLSPGDDRWAERSVTYPGVAEAMAGQWGDFTNLAKEESCVLSSKQLMAKSKSAT